jgi:hypothetical protein
MPKYIIIFAILAIAIMPVVAFAQPSVVSLPNPFTVNTIEDLLEAIINWLLILVLPVVVLIISFAGVQFMIGGSSPQQRTNAINMIKYALIGYTVILLSRLILGLVTGLLG